MELVHQLFDSKGQAVWHVEPETSVYAAISLMAEMEVGALMVHKQGKPIAPISECDYARKVILSGRSSKETRVKDIMNRRIVCVGPNRTIEECMALITEKRVRHLPVIEHKELIGIISIGELVKAIISEQKFMIEQLEHYISS